MARWFPVVKGLYLQFHVPHFKWYVCSSAMTVPSVGMLVGMCDGAWVD